MLKGGLKKMETYTNQRYGLGMLFSHHDLKAIFGKSEPLSPMSSLEVESMNTEDEDIKTHGLQKFNDPIVMSPLQQRPLDDSVLFPSCHSIRKLSMNDVGNFLDALYFWGANL